MATVLYQKMVVKNCTDPIIARRIWSEEVSVSDQGNNVIITGSNGSFVSIQPTKKESIRIQGRMGIIYTFKTGEITLLF